MKIPYYDNQYSYFGCDPTSYNQTGVKILKQGAISCVFSLTFIVILIYSIWSFIKVLSKRKIVNKSAQILCLIGAVLFSLAFNSVSCLNGIFFCGNLQTTDLLSFLSFSLFLLSLFLFDNYISYSFITDFADYYPEILDNIIKIQRIFFISFIPSFILYVVSEIITEYICHDSIIWNIISDISYFITLGLTFITIYISFRNYKHLLDRIRFSAYRKIRSMFYTLIKLLIISIISKLCWNTLELIPVRDGKNIAECLLLFGLENGNSLYILLLNFYIILSESLLDITINRMVIELAINHSNESFIYSNENT